MVAMYIYIYITFNILKQNTCTKWVKVINMVFRNQNYYQRYKFAIPFKESHKSIYVYIFVYIHTYIHKYIHA